MIKPALDTRFGRESVTSRAGLTREADILVAPDSDLPRDKLAGAHCILVDEAQFLSERVVEQLRSVATELSIPVICYGLRGDFRTRLFPGSRRLMELADEISEVKTTCAYCNRKAVFNLKLVGGQPSQSGPVVDLGSEEKYLPTCAKCYEAKLTGAWNLNEELEDVE